MVILMPESGPYCLFGRLSDEEKGSMFVLTAGCSRHPLPVVDGS